MSHRQSRYADLELEFREEIIDGLRHANPPMGYRRIADLLGIPARKVELVLGECAALAAVGFSQGEISRRVGLPRSTVQDLLRSKGSRVSNARRTAVLTVLAQMRGMQLDVLGWFLDMDRNHVYVLVRRLREDKLVHGLEQVQPGEKWVYPTRESASRYLGWPAKQWVPPTGLAEHYRVVAQARIMLVGAAPDRWVSERQLIRRARTLSPGTKRGGLGFSTGREPAPGVLHIHDGRFHGVARGTGRRGWWALEVELSRKDNQHLDVALQGAIRSALRRDEPETMIGVLYLCRSVAVREGLYRAADRLPPELRNLPEFDLVISDFDDQWSEFLANRANQKAAAQRQRRTLIQLAKEAS